MIYSINDQKCTENNLSLEEAITLLLLYKKVNIDETITSLSEKNLINAEYGISKIENWVISKEGKELIESVLLDSDKKQNSLDRITSLAMALKIVFPKGKKDGTNLYWAEGTALIVKRLRLFFKKYEDTFPEIYITEYQTLTEQEFNNFIDNQIIKAAESYVKSFNGIYTYMKVLKYFLFKEKIGAARDIESESDLLNYLENYNQEEETNRDWTTQLK
jgi:3-methyladenine DNA glycosylase AlkD